MKLDGTFKNPTFARNWVQEELSDSIHDVVLENGLRLAGVQDSYQYAACVCIQSLLKGTSLIEEVDENTFFHSSACDKSESLNPASADADFDIDKDPFDPMRYIKKALGYGASREIYDRDEIDRLMHAYETLLQGNKYNKESLRTIYDIMSAKCNNKIDKGYLIGAIIDEIFSNFIQFYKFFGPYSIESYLMIDQTEELRRLCIRLKHQKCIFYPKTSFKLSETLGILENLVTKEVTDALEEGIETKVTGHFDALNEICRSLIQYTLSCEIEACNYSVDPFAINFVIALYKKSVRSFDPNIPKSTVLLQTARKSLLCQPNENEKDFILLRNFDTAEFLQLLIAGNTPALTMEDFAKDLSYFIDAIVDFYKKCYDLENCTPDSVMEYLTELSDDIISYLDIQLSKAERDELIQLHKSFCESGIH